MKESYHIVINDVKNFSIAEEYFEEDDELIGNFYFGYHQLPTNLAINSQIIGPIMESSILPGDKPISHITRVLASAGTSYPVILARNARTSVTSDDKQVEINKVNELTQLTLQRSNDDNRTTVTIGDSLPPSLPTVVQATPVQQSPPIEEKFIYLDIVISKYQPGGYGFSMKFDKASPVVKVVKPDSPAENAHLRVEDEIYSVNGVIVEGLPSTKILQLVGEDPEELNLRVKRSIQEEVSILETTTEEYYIDLIIEKKNEETYGFSLKFNDQYPIVGVIKPNSPASKTDLKLNDRLVELNGESVANLTKNKVFERIKQSPNMLKLKIDRPVDFDTSSDESDTNYDQVAVVPDHEMTYHDVIIHKSATQSFGFGLDFTTESPKVKTIKPNTPAEASYLHMMDELYSVNGVLVSGLNATEVINLINQDPEMVNLRVRRIKKIIEEDEEDDTEVAEDAQSESKSDDEDNHDQFPADNQNVSPVFQSGVPPPVFLQEQEDIPEDLIHQHEQELENMIGRPQIEVETIENRDDSSESESTEEEKSLSDIPERSESETESEFTSRSDLPYDAPIGVMKPAPPVTPVPPLPTTESLSETAISQQPKKMQQVEATEVDLNETTTYSEASTLVGNDSIASADEVEEIKDDDVNLINPINTVAAAVVVKQAMQNKNADSFETADDQGDDVKEGDVNTTWTEAEISRLEMEEKKVAKEDIDESSVNEDSSTSESDSDTEVDEPKQSDVFDQNKPKPMPIVGKQEPASEPTSLTKPTSSMEHIKAQLSDSDTDSETDSETSSVSSNGEAPMVELTPDVQPESQPEAMAEIKKDIISEKMEKPLETQVVKADTSTTETSHDAQKLNDLPPPPIFLQNQSDIPEDLIKNHEKELENMMGSAQIKDQAVDKLDPPIANSDTSEEIMVTQIQEKNQNDEAPHLDNQDPIESPMNSTSIDNIARLPEFIHVDSEKKSDIESSTTSDRSDSSIDDHEPTGILKKTENEKESNKEPKKVEIIENPEVTISKIGKSIAVMAAANQNNLKEADIDQNQVSVTLEKEAEMISESKSDEENLNSDDSDSEPTQNEKSSKPTILIKPNSNVESMIPTSNDEPTGSQEADLVEFEGNDRLKRDPSPPAESTIDLENFEKPEPTDSTDKIQLEEIQKTKTEVQMDESPGENSSNAEVNDVRTFFTHILIQKCDWINLGFVMSHI